MVVAVRPKFAISPRERLSRVIVEEGALFCRSQAARSPSTPGGMGARRPSVVSHGWRKSSFSGVAECVEVAREGDVVCVRNSNSPKDPHIRSSLKEFRQFINAIKDADLKV
jgi:hypothetical protein